MTRSRLAVTLATLVAILAIPQPASSSLAQEQGAVETPVTIEITREDDDGEILLFATVTLDGEPVEGALVTFAVVRTFGAFVLGSEETFDDGTAAVEFPIGIPGDASGHFTVVASIEGDADMPPASASASFKSDAPPASTQELFPEALWSARPLWPLVAVIAVLVAGVWCTYAFVIVQLLKLRS